jgi:sugar O-acyltransferase (sialic acid O-acetyltransferase NeuD family)
VSPLIVRHPHLQDQRKLVVIGASGHAKVILDILCRQDSHEIIGMLDENKPIDYECDGHKVLGARSELAHLLSVHKDLDVVVGVGDNWIRHRIVADLRRLHPQVTFASAIHPSAQIGHGVHIGQGTVITAGVIVAPGASIGEFCILNTRCSLDHDSQMGSFSSLGPAVATGGNVEVGEFSAIGMSATLLQSVCIGAHSVIGAGAVVLQCVPDHVVAYGSPARVIRTRQEGEKYLGEVRRA